jgi:hypothetical protein
MQLVNAEPCSALAAIGLRITEEPSLYGLVVREAGQLIEFVSYSEAARRLGAHRQPLAPPPVVVQR